MKSPLRWTDQRGWGWRHCAPQLLIVLAVAGFIVPAVVLYGS